jgi:hypothetical protein
MKDLIISLNGDVKFTHISYKDTLKAINDGVDLIVTPNIQFFNYQYIVKGYRVTARTEQALICLNSLINSKRVRPAQNAANMLLSNCFADLGIIIENEME